MRKDLFTWQHDGLTYKLIDGHDLVGLDSGNVRRAEYKIDGSQVGGRIYDALDAAPDDVKRLRVVAETLSHGEYIMQRE